jgi:hypothetical protein
VPGKVWKRHWNVGCQAAGSGENALRYLSRYVFKTATGNRTVPLLPDGRLRWNYRESKTGKHTSVKLEPRDFMRRFLQHVLPRSFARVRTFGWLHPAARARANRVRALLRQAPLLTPAEKDTWQPPAEPDLETPAGTATKALCSTPLCPLCRHAMRLAASWHAGHVTLYPSSAVAALRSVDKRPP